MKKLLILVFIFFLFNVKVNAVSVSAKSAVLMNIDTKEVLYERNKDEKLLTASIAKIMTAIICIENTNLFDKVNIIKEDIYQEGSSVYFKIGDVVTIEDLLHGLLLRSGNDCAYVIARVVGGDINGFSLLMNEKAKELKMTNSHFSNPSGLDEVSENYSSAYDMALLMSYAYKNDKFMEINNTVSYKTTIKDRVCLWINKHRLIKKNSIYNGGKTGYTKKAGRTLVTTARIKNLNFVVVTFKSGNDWNEHENLINYGSSKYDKTLVLKKQVYELPDYKLGYIKEDEYLFIEEKDLNKVKIKFYIDNNLNTNNIIGEYFIYYNNYLVSKNYIYSYNPLDETNDVFFEILNNL